MTADERNEVIEECAKECDRSANEIAGSYNGGDPYLRGCEREAQSLAIAIRALKTAPPGENTERAAPLGTIATSGATPKARDRVSGQDEAGHPADAAPCATCNGDPAVCATVPGLRHCEAAARPNGEARDPWKLYCEIYEEFFPRQGFAALSPAVIEEFAERLAAHSANGAPAKP